MDVMTLAAKLTLNTSEFDSGLQNSEKEMKGLSSGGVAWGNLVSRMVEKAGKAMFNFGKQTVQVGMDFDTQMSQVKALGQLTDENFIKVREKAMDLGASTKFTAAQVAEAFSYMALAGWDTDEMLDGIEGMLSLAAASGEDLGRTSDIVTDALTAFGLEAKDSGHFVDVLAQASANSNTTVSQMGEAFKYLATTGGVLNYSIEDVALALGLLANNGIKSSQAGTSLRRIITSLISPTDKAADAMSALGVNLFEEGTDKVKPFKQVLTELRTIFKESDFNLEGIDMEKVQPQLDELDAWYDEMSQKIEAGGGSIKDSVDGSVLQQADIDAEYAERIKAITGANELFLGRLSDIGGVRGISSLIALMKTTDKDFDQLVNSVENSEGAAQQMAETMLNNLEGDITILKSAVEGLQIVVSDEFKQPFRDFVKMLTEEVGKLNEAFKANGVLGMFLEVAEWIITGVADSLSNPDDAQVEKFGKAIGEFIGKVAAKLITSLPDMISGIIELGVSLATGLLEGLAKGLSGESSEVQKFVDGMNAELEGIEVNSVKAQGLLSYLQELAEAGDENVTKTEAWKTAVEQLEEVMPGAKEILEAEGATIDENIEKLRIMTDEYRKKAIQQAMVNTLQKEYELLAEQGVEREKAAINYGIAKNEQEEIRNQYLQSISDYAKLISESGATGEMGEMVSDLLAGKEWAGDSYASISDYDVDNLKRILDMLAGYEGLNNPWDTDQKYLSPDEINALKDEYDNAGKKMKTANDTISKINDEMTKTKDSIATTEKAVNSVTAELNASATDVATAGTNLANAINGVAEDARGYPHSHAIGSAYIPYDNYPALLHRGERVVTATENRRGTNQIDIAKLEDRIEAAIRSGMANAKVSSYLNGQDITDDVSRNTVRELKARRFST